MDVETRGANLFTRQQMDVLAEILSGRKERVLQAQIDVEFNDEISRDGRNLIETALNVELAEINEITDRIGDALAKSNPRFNRTTWNLKTARRS